MLEKGMMTTKATTVIDYIVQRIADEGIEHCFGVPGDYAFPVGDNATSNDLKNSIKRLTFNTASVNDEMGMEIFYDFAITPAIRFMPSYQHIWDPIAARVSKHENWADLFLSRMTVAF